jgi:hypothetical protein
MAVHAQETQIDGDRARRSFTAGVDTGGIGAAADGLRSGLTARSRLRSKTDGRRHRVLYDFTACWQVGILKAKPV